MKRSYSCALASFAICPFLWHCQIFAQDAAPRTPQSPSDVKQLERLDQWARLNGIKRVQLSVSVGDAISAVVSKDQVQNDAELALRTRGIVVKTMLDESGTDGFLNIDIRSVPSRDGSSQAIYVRVEFQESSTPTKIIPYCGTTAPRDNPTHDKMIAVLNCLDFYSVLASVWAKDELWILGSNRLGTARQSAKDLVDAFLIDWLRANEKH